MMDLLVASSFPVFWRVGLWFFRILRCFLRRLQRRIGRTSRGWFAKERTLENALFIGMYVFMAVLIVIGVYFRGANWEIVYPWIPVTGGDTKCLKIIKFYLG